MQRLKGKLTDRELTIILIFGVLGFVIVAIGFVMWDYRVWTVNFWSPTTLVVSYPYRDLAPIFLAIGVFVIILGLPFSSMYAKGRDDLSFGRICLSCGRQVPEQTKFCPYCGKKILGLTSS